jgi:hypothetical protein
MQFVLGDKTRAIKSPKWSATELTALMFAGKLTFPFDDNGTLIEVGRIAHNPNFHG